MAQTQHFPLEVLVLFLFTRPPELPLFPLSWFSSFLQIQEPQYASSKLSPV